MLAEIFLVTAYSWGCGATQLTYTENIPQHDTTVAADPSVLKFGTEIDIPGYGTRYVHDIGSAIKGNHIDLFVEDCKVAKKFGVQRIPIKVLKKGSMFYYQKRWEKKYGNNIRVR